VVDIGTLFKEIYEMNEVLKSDNRLINKPQNLIYQLYFTYLKYAIGIFKYDSRVDLTARTDFSMQVYNYIADRSDNVYSLSPIPTPNSNFYVGYRSDSDAMYTEIHDYVYDNINNTITINDFIDNRSEVYISSYIIGSFDNDLDEYGVDILSEAMLVPWSTEQLMKNSLLSQMVLGEPQKYIVRQTIFQKLKMSLIINI